MSRNEIYPWTNLVNVGDYFAVTNELKGERTYTFMNSTVLQRNYLKKGELRYGCFKTSYGCIVMLVEIGENIPPYDYQTVEGVLARTVYNGDSIMPGALGNRPKARELTQSEKIKQLPQTKRQANLPWWYDNGKLIWNSNTAIPKRDEDLEAWMTNTFKFGPDDPYPSFYNLDESFEIVKVDEDDDEIEPWENDPAPIIDGEEQPE